MILPDVNVLIYAFDADADRHTDYRAWLAAALAGAEGLALADVVLAGFIRITTHPRIMRHPARTATAVEFVGALQASKPARPITATNAVWSTFRRLVDSDRAIAGNLVPDAFLAALAIAHGARIATADRGFGRFPDLGFFDPVQP